MHKLDENVLIFSNSSNYRERHHIFSENKGYDEMDLENARLFAKSLK